LSEKVAQDMMVAVLSWSILQFPWYQLEGLAAQGIILHFFFLVSFLGQAFPLYFGCVMILLSITTQPRPQDAEQADQSDQSET